MGNSLILTVILYRYGLIYHASLIGQTTQKVQLASVMQPPPNLSLDVNFSVTVQPAAARRTKERSAGYWPLKQPLPFGYECIV